MTDAMIHAEPGASWDPLRRAIADNYRTDETACVEALLAEADLDGEPRRRVAKRAQALIASVREGRQGAGGIDAFLQEYELSTQEGVMLMCLAEALLRIPDDETADRLIRDKLGDADWEGHLGRSNSLFVNASTWGLMLTGRIVRLDPGLTGAVGSALGRLVAQSGEPVIRQALIQAMRILGRQFVMGRTISEALERAEPAEAEGYRHSYDMLGEAARTQADANRYMAAYGAAIDAIGGASNGGDVFAQPSISVKLSALHPRFEYAQSDRVLGELAPRLLILARRAMDHGIGFTVDAEEADRLEPSLDVIEAVYGDPALDGWEGFGVALQTYLKRAPQVIDWLAALARRGGRRIPLRVVKGAYWDAEIKRAQEFGLDGYPVFTRKASTDVSYIACSRRVLAAGGAFYPQFATHNAQTLAVVLELAGDNRDFEFQRLHGMGEALYGEIVGPDKLDIPCRVYAPVGSHEELLPYLVRRLLENGSNTSFVNRIVDEALPVAEIAADPVVELRATDCKPHPRIPLPADLYGEGRTNAHGIDLTDRAALEPLAKAMAEAVAAPLRAGPAGAGRQITDPADRRRVVGSVVEAGCAAVEQAVATAVNAFPDWATTPAGDRAACLDRMAALLEENTAEAMAICVREAGKTIVDALAEVREAVDFCRYYATRARADFATPVALPGPTGESNQISLHGRGVFACIAPWNFPLAIFTGQVTAALVAGNAVIAKPAEQTPLIADFAVRLLHRAGVPEAVVQLLPGGGDVGARLVRDERIAGVAFTGSTETARIINRALAAKDGPIVPLIAETGGQNAMIVDSSALPEQVIADTLTSAFGSAGQRCSALRVLFVQAEIAPRLIAMLAGAMDELRVGNPALLSTDVGPVIDEAARDMLNAHGEAMTRYGSLIKRVAMPPETEHGTFVAPAAFEIDSLDRLEREVFGPILHVVRYKSDRLDHVIKAVNRTGYGLTLGIHSRIDEVVDYIASRVRVGNAYVNRNMVGAVVGVQPFGGEGLSGTGPKAGGPRYLHRFATERVISTDTTAAGGNASLLSLEDEG
jgi:RHH-type transcriptional regulator, proline utilization regulon repressor / proline dehydrogenase / delta 1-pyrroline-5-carboxylate dehydrogenase